MIKYLKIEMIIPFTYYAKVDDSLHSEDDAINEAKQRVINEMQDLPLILSELCVRTAKIQDISEGDIPGIYDSTEIDGDLDLINLTNQFNKPVKPVSKTA